MKISINWLNEYFNQQIDKLELVNKFNLMSQEVAGLSKLVDVEGLLIGHVKSLEKHPDADKLSVCQVDVKNELLQIICGAPNVAQGQKVIVAKTGVVLPGDFKIKKVKIRGIESNGMICSLAELDVQEFDVKEKGIYVLPDDAQVGEDPLKYLGLDDYVLELDLTANRSDLLSIRGVAYDTACMLDWDLNIPDVRVIREGVENPVNIYTTTRDSSTYYGQVVENIKVKDSPFWLKSRLISAGIRPINNVVDVTNYVMLEYGQPLHAFDYDKISSDRIIVREAKTGEKIVTLDGEERSLLAGDVVITDGTKPIALAGVMGGLETEIDEKSSRILLESAVFNPVKVRRTANRLNLKSESSSRFEKGIDASKTLEALNRACELLIQYANAIGIGRPSFYNTANTKDKIISLSLEKLNSIVGYTFDEETVENILTRLRFSFKNKSGEFRVKIPNRRPMESYQDLVEEIVRINGYDKIPLSIPETPTQGGLSDRQKTKRSIRSFLVNRGLNETKTYSLVNEENACKFDLKATEIIKIMNPLTQERECLRHSLLPSLTSVLSYNKSRKIEDVQIFEIGNTYFKDTETEKIAILLNGSADKSTWQKDEGQIDFYYIKGLVEALFEQLNIKNYAFGIPSVNIVNLHPGISAEIVIQGKVCGFIGKLHPEEEHEIGVKDVYVCEFETDNIYKSKGFHNTIYQEISKYPSIKRDIAILVDDGVQAQKIVDVIKINAKKTLKAVEIFDIYQDISLGSKKSIALTLEFMSADRTLETKEVDDYLENIVSSLEEQLSAQLRK
jgi:phenylalanyl-tRNA synthetase beta chain